MNERACFAIWAWNPDNPEEFYEHTRIGRVYTEEGAAFWSQVVEAAMKAGLAWADFVGEKMKEWRDGKEE